MALIIFWYIFLRKFKCSSKFLISFTEWYTRKLRVFVPNTNHFKPIIFKFKIFVYNSNSKIMYNFCIYGGDTPPPPGENFFFIVGIFRKNALKYTKLAVELYICDNLKQIYRFFIFNKPILREKSLKNVLGRSSGRQYIDFFRTFMIILFWFKNRLLFFEIKLL